MVKELDVMRTLRIGNEIEDRPAPQGGDRDQAKKGKAAAGFLLGFLGIKFLIGWGVRHRKPGAIDKFNSVAMP